MESLNELLNFLHENVRLDLKVVALEHLLGITGSQSGIETLLGSPEILRQLILLLDDDCKPVAKDASVCLVNISANEQGSNALLLLSESSEFDHQGKSCNLIHCCLKNIIDKKSTIADPCCMILSNMSRWHPYVDRIVSLIEKSNISSDALIDTFTSTKYNETGANLHYLGPLFSNLSQSSHMRQYLLNKETRIIQRLLPFTEYDESVIRRGGIVGTLRNCCFDVEYHEYLLSPEIDILTYLLLPLAGPEEFSDEDNEKLPLDLQYLPHTKKRELDPDIRLMLLEALTQLCTTRKCRDILREKNVYVILRELHKWEKDEAVLLACENLVNILIRTEDEIGIDDLKKIEIPDEYKEKFARFDEQFKTANKSEIKDM